MSLEREHSEGMSRCENCGGRSLSIVIIEGHVFCSNLCYTEWKWNKEKQKQNLRKTVRVRWKGSAVRDRPPTGARHKMYKSVEKSFQIDGNRRGSPPEVVDKKKLEEAGG